MPAPVFARSRRLVVLVFAAASSACVTSPVYWPNSVNTPQIMQRGDVEAAVMVSPDGFTQVQASAAVTRSIVVVANGNYTNQGCGTCAPRQHEFAEVGIGKYSTDINDRTISYLAGYGVGHSDWVSASHNGGLGLAAMYRAKGTYSRGFFQVGGVERRENFDVATSIRFTGVFFSNYERFALDTAATPDSYTKPQAYKGSTWSLYVEPSLRILWNIKSVRIGPQFGFIFPLNAPPAIGHRPVTFNLGLNFGGR